MIGGFTWPDDARPNGIGALLVGHIENPRAAGTATAPRNPIFPPRPSATPSRSAGRPRRRGAASPSDTAFIDADTLDVARSSQRYDRLGAQRLRYVDLGQSRGFQADLDVDEDGLVLRYEHLFERLHG